MLDAICAAADIAYPTDLSLLNEACEMLEASSMCCIQLIVEVYPNRAPIGKKLKTSNFITAYY
jgi:hypothetical protein